MITVQLNQQELYKLQKKVQRMAQFDQVFRKEIISSSRKVSRIYVSTVRSNIRDYSATIVVKRKSGTTITIPPGTLRRSIGTWIPKGAASHVASGPRAGTLGKRLPQDRDGWFAHFVESGARPEKFGGQQTTPNVGVFERSKKQVDSRIRTEMTTIMVRMINKAADK
jgi:hypothetical protein